MKNLFVLFLVLTNTFLLSITNNVHAQEATLVKQGEWGSASYLEVVSLNGYFYAATSFGQIDVIDQEKSGVASFIAQINVEANILSMQVHNNRLAIVTEDKLSIYNISNTKTLTLNYSVELSSQHSNDKLFVSDKIYFLSDDNKVFIIQEDDGNYSMKKL